MTGGLQLQAIIHTKSSPKQLGQPAARESRRAPRPAVATRQVIIMTPSINGYEMTPELYSIVTQLELNDKLIEHQRNILAWCNAKKEFNPVDADRTAAYARYSADAMPFIDECARKANDELHRLELERKSLMLKFQTVRQRTPYNPTIPFK